MKTKNKKLLLVLLIMVSGCGQSQQFVAVPANAKKEGTPQQLIQVKAERFKFTPDIIRVKTGTLVRLEVTSVEGEHGFQLGSFGIDEEIEEGQTRIVEFYASKAGEYNFRCSHFCGIGHLGMTGKVIVE